jgi:hypothetical protein
MSSGPERRAAKERRDVLGEPLGVALGDHADGADSDRIDVVSPSLTGTPFGAKTGP